MKLFSDLFKKTLNVYIEIRGRDSVLAEGYCRIEKYSETEIILASENERISVQGAGLGLRHISSERMAIEGRIDSVGFLQADTLSFR